MAKRKNGLSPEIEQKLLDAVVKTAELVDDNGMRPDEALAKIATEQGLTPNHITLVGHAFNTGRTNLQRMQSTNTLDKLASVPLTDPQAVIAKVYPDKVAPSIDKEASNLAPFSGGLGWLRRVEGHREYEASESRLVKAASCPAAGLPPQLDARPARPVAMTDRENWGKYQTQKAAVDALNDDTVRLEMEISKNLNALEQYFKKSATDRASLPAVWKSARQLFGSAVNTIFEHTEQRLAAADNPAPFAKRAWDRGDLQTDARAVAIPFRYVGAAVRMAKELAPKAARLKQASAAIELKRRFLLSPPVKTAAVEKSGIMSMIGGMMGAAMSAKPGQSESNMSLKPTGEMVDSTMAQMSDPRHEANLRRIETEATLHDIMANDEVLGGNDPESILSAYNTLSELAPHAMSSPGGARPLLRRYMAGELEPFELEQIGKIERSLSSPARPAGPSDADQNTYF